MPRTNIINIVGWIDTTTKHSTESILAQRQPMKYGDETAVFGEAYKHSERYENTHATRMSSCMRVTGHPE